MPSLRRLGAAFGALSLLVTTSCADESVLSPEVEEGRDPNLALVDGTVLSGTNDFFFLPPTVPEAPTTIGEFNPNLSPEIRICELDGGPVPSSVCVATIEEIPTSAIEIRENSYRHDWDPKGPNTGRVNSKRFYRAQVIVLDSVIGYVDLDPIGGRDKGGAQDFDPNAYAYQFRPRSQTVPLEFFLSVQNFCEGEAFVTECITGVAVNNDGATLRIEDEGRRLGVIIAQNSLPAPFEQVLVTLERIDPVIFRQETGEECIPGVSGLAGFDAPQFGDCFRVETVPELNDPLLAESVVSICLDVTNLGLTLQQQGQLRMVKYSDTDGDWTALEETAGDCPTAQASMFDVPESGFMRYAAMGANALARMVGPEPVAARFTRFGGLNSSFSRFRFALPGEMVATTGDGTVIQSADDNTIPATITVLDAGDDDGLNRQPVAGATVRFTPDAGAGTVDVSEVVTGADGTATVQWTVDRSTPGPKVLTASSFGLFGGPIPDPDGVEYDFIAEDVTFTATVVGEPSQVTQSPDSNIEDAVAGVPESLTIIVSDAAGNEVEGATVTWQCTPTCTFGEGTQNPDGSAQTTSTSGAGGVASIEWTPLSAGSTLTAVADINADQNPEATFTATVAPAAAVEPTWPTVPMSAEVGETLTGLSFQVTDEFGNARSGDPVTWTITTGNGSVVSVNTTTDADGFATNDWTLDETAGANELTIATGAFQTMLEVEGTAGSPVQPLAVGSGQSGTVATALSTQLSFRLADSFGNPIAGVPVSWSGDGSVAPAATTTDANGVAQGTWTLGNDAGAQGTTASVAGFNVNFTATAAPGVAVEPTYSAVPTEEVVGTTLEGITVTVTDQFGNARNGDAVTYSVTGGGSVPAAGGSTGTNGVATTSWTLGTLVGSNTLTIQTVAGTSTFTKTFTVGTNPDAPFRATGSGSGQSGVVNTALGTPLSVTVVDQYGNAVPGEAVTFAGNGSFSPAATTTDASGQASAVWTLGTTSGGQSATATAAGFPVGFTANASPGAPANLMGAGGGVTQEVATSTPLQVTVTDAFGNAVPGATVTWSGDGSFSSTTTNADANGVASVTWTLGTVAGGQSASASVSGVAPANFNATATPGAAAILEQSGGGGEYDEGSTITLSIRATDQYGNAIDGEAVAWAVNAGRLASTQNVTANNGRATARWTLPDDDDDEGMFTATATVGGLTATFNARVND